MSVYLKVFNKYGKLNTPLPPPFINLDINETTVISYHSNGNIASRFGDNIWDFSAISSSNQYFTFDTNKFPASIINELKLLTYARIYWAPSIRSISSIRQKPLLSLAEWALANKFCVSQILNEERIYPWIASSASSLNRRDAETLAALVGELAKIRVLNDNLKIAPPDFKLAITLRDIAESIPKERKKQTAIIPTRIYAELIISFEQLLREFNNNSNNIKNFYEYIVPCLETGGQFKTSSGYKRWYKKPTNYKKIIDDYNLSSLVEKHGLTDKKRWNVYVRDVQETAKYWIHLFTGMRDQEVNTLARECVGALDIKGAKAKIIRGYTTKTIGSGAASTYWITSDIIDIGIEACHAIGEIGAIQNKWILHPTEFPLLPTLFPLDKAKSNSRFHKNAQFTSGFCGTTRTANWLARFPSLNVTDADLAELYVFDGFRDWSDEIKSGHVWPLATHQCRRSLAVYLARSGLVSIGSMQLQFKHLLSAMTSYYRRNSSFAINFIFNNEKDEFHQAQIKLMESLETEKRVAQFLDYEEKVVKNQAKLWGGEGTRIRRAFISGKPLIIVSGRPHLKQSFMSGEMSFREGPIGGCTNIGTCDNLSVTKIGGPCLGCANFIGDDDSIAAAELALKTLYKTRDRYKKSSLHYRQVQSDINDFETKLNKARGAQND